MKSICEMTVKEIREAYDKKELTVQEVTRAFLDNIKEKDEEIKAYITVCEEEAMKKSQGLSAASEENTD